MRHLIPTLASTLFCAVLGAQSTCLSPSNWSTTWDHHWYWNLEVTNPQGITLQWIALRGGTPGSTPIGQLWLRDGGAATLADATDPSVWTLHDERRPTGQRPEFHDYDFRDLYLPPGTYGFAFHRDPATSGVDTQRYKTGSLGMSNADLTWTGVGWSSDAFSGTSAARTFVGCMHYAVGHVTTDVSVSATANGAALTTSVTADPADLQGVSVAPTPAVLQFHSGNDVELHAPLYATDPSGRGVLFKQWLGDVDPADVRGNTLSTWFDDDVALTAEYEAVNGFESDLGPGLGMGDDTLSVGHALGFDFPLPGGGTTNAIDISSNGFVWLVSGSSTDPSPVFGSQSLIDDPARVCVLWKDLDLPTAASDVHFKTFPGRAVITWRRAVVKNRSELFTLQCTLLEDGRVVLAHLGDLPQTIAVIGITQGNGSAHPEPVDVDFDPEWRVTGNGWWWLPFPGQLAPRVMLSLPTADGYVGGDVTAAYAPAAANSYGVGCGTPASFYQMNDGADLAGRSFRMTPNTVGGFDVSECATSCFDPVIGTATGIGDDALHTVALPFVFPYPGNAAGSNSIDVCSNGYVWLQTAAGNTSLYTPVAASLFASAARLAPFWVDLNSTDPLSDDVYVDVRADRVVVTWHDVVQFSGTTPLTAQCVLFADGTMTLAYGSQTTVTGQVLTGWSQGGGAASVAPWDLPASVPFVVSGEDHSPVVLSTNFVPVPGEDLLMTVSNLPIAPTVGLLLFGFAETSLDLGFLGAPGCLLLGTSDVIDAGLLLTEVADWELRVPASSQLIGLDLFAQAAAYAPGFNALGFVTSNGLQLTIGEF